MTRIRLYQWLGVSILGVATGCGSTRSGSTAQAPTAPRGVALVYANKGTASQSPRTYKQATPMAPAYVNQAGYQVMTMPNGEGVVTADHSVVEGAPVGQEIIQTGSEPPLAPAQAQASPYAGHGPATNSNSNAGQWAPVVEHVVPARNLNLYGESIPNRRAVTDITASPCFSKAEDYSWLQGVVEYSRLSKSWRLRYASVDEVDKFGGSVTLTGDTLLDSLKDGQQLRVKGYLPNTEARGIAPAYRVEAIESIESNK